MKTLIVLPFLLSRYSIDPDYISFDVRLGVDLANQVPWTENPILEGTAEFKDMEHADW